MKVYLNAYLQKNLGDDLFVYILMNRYKNHEFYTMTVDKTYRNMFEHLHVLDQKYVVKVLKKFSLKSLVASHCDLVLTLGGSMFIENPGDKDRNFSIGKNDHYILGVNFGPYKTQQYFDNIKGFLATAKDVCFREDYSYQLFKELPNVRKASDIVFSLPLDGIELKEDKHVVFSVVSCKNKVSEVYEKQYIETMTDMIKHFHSLDYKITLMSFCDYEGDEAVIDQLLNLLKGYNYINRYDYKGNIKEALNVMGSSSVIVGSRFHANIIGLLMGKTVIPVLYSDKTKNVLNDLDFDGLVIDIRGLNRFDLSMLNEDSLQYKLDVSKAKKSAQKHFEKLDERLG